MLQKKPTAVIRRPVSNAGFTIEQSEGRADIFHTSWIVIGPPGVGKSTLFSGFPNVLFLVTSTKEVKRLKVPYVLIDSWEKLLMVTDDLVNNRETKYAKYKCIAIDFIDAVWTLCVGAVCAKYKIDHQSEAAYGKGSDTIDKYFREWFTTIIASDYTVLVVSHVVQKEQFTSGGTVTKSICTLKERARNILFPLVNVVGCMGYKTIKEKSSVDPTKVVLVRRRVIEFEETDYVEAKDRDGVLPKEIVLFTDPHKNFQLFLNYYEGRGKK